MVSKSAPELQFLNEKILPTKNSVELTSIYLEMAVESLRSLEVKRGLLLQRIQHLKGIIERESKGGEKRNEQRQY